jgi:hypothetical protein
MLEGLYSYEIVLMALGTILFVVLAVVLGIYVFQNRAITTLFPFFLLPVVMIGFPAFQKITYDNGKLELEKNLQKVTADAGDRAVRTQLEDSLKQVASRPTSDPKTLVTVARAYKVLGQPDQAKQHVTNALRLNPHLNEAVRLSEELKR